MSLPTSHSSAAQRRRERFARGLPSEDPRHGTIGGYTNWGCRCPACSDAHLRPRRDARRATPRSGEPLNLPDEVWLPASGLEGLYEVSNLGRVRSCDGHQRVPQIIRQQRGRYVRVSLWVAGRAVSAHVHRLVCASFNGPPLPGQVTRHLNGNPYDNRPENLRFGTDRENQLDRIEHGRNEQVNKTHCIRGHAFDEINTIRRRQGWRDCRACKRARSRPSGSR